MQKRSILNRITKQAKPHPKLGAFQVQLSMSTSHYLVYVNLCFMGMMFWHTTAAPWLRQNIYQGASFWMFATFMLLLISMVMFLDKKFIYPSRQAFISQQAYKHDNPAVADLKKILKNQEKIINRIGIDTEIVCLCGSTRFVDIFNEYRKKLTYEGKIVLSIEIVTSQTYAADPQNSLPELKVMLDNLHLCKIDLCHKVFVINKDGYIGESTTNEINYAKSIGKPIEYLEKINV